MKLMLLVYLASIADGVALFCGFFGFILLILTVSAWCAVNFSDYGVIAKSYDNEKDFENKKRVKKLVNRLSYFLIPLFFLMLLVGGLLPKEKTIYIMAGAYLTEEVVTSPRVQKIGNDVLELVEGKLSEMKVKDLETSSTKTSEETVAK